MSNQQQNQTIYVPKSFAKARTFDWGEVISLAFGVPELEQIIKEHASNGMLRLDIVPRKNVTESSTHSVKVNNWKPQEQAAQSTQKAAPTGKKSPPKSPVVDDQEPF